MANKKQDTVTNGRVNVYIPRGEATDDPNFFVSVNGPDTLLPKGKKSEVKWEEGFEIKRAELAQENYNRKMEAMLEQANG